MNDEVLTSPPAGGALSIDESVSYSRIGRSKLYGLIRTGDIRVVKIGRRTIIPRSELDAYLARNTRSLFG